jgi:hypothetical protein
MLAVDIWNARVSEYAACRGAITSGRLEAPEGV